MLALFWAYFGLGLILLGYYEAAVPLSASFQGITNFYVSPTTLSVGCLVWGVVAFAWWWALAQCESRKKLDRKEIRQMCGGVLLLLIAGVLAKPVSSIDLFIYIINGRQIVHHGHSPYLYTPADSLPDPFLEQIGTVWFHVTAPYGVVALALFSAATLIPWPTLWSAMVGMKAMMGIGVVALVPVLSRMLRDDPLRYTKIAMMVSSPLVIWLYVVDGHNDILGLLTLLWAVQLAKERRPAWSALVLALACGVKIVFLVVVPVLFCWLARHSQRLSTIFTAVFSLAYGAMAAIGKGGEFAMTVYTDEIGLGLANFVPRIFWFFDLPYSQVKLGSDIVFLVFGAVLCLSLLLGRFSDDPMFPTALVCTVLVLSRTFWQAWYSIWFWPLLALCVRRKEAFFQIMALWMVSVPLYSSHLIEMRDLKIAAMVFLSLFIVIRERRRIASSEQK